MSFDKPQEPCHPYCEFPDTPDEVDIQLCDHCGSLWRRGPVTEVDPGTMLPVQTVTGWWRS